MEMEKRMLKKFIILILLLFLIPLANAVSMNLPSQANINEKITLRISASEFYAIEIKIPQSFEIVADPSNGNRIDDIFRTFYNGNLDITLRPTISGNYIISGEYTSGYGINNLNSQNIEVKETIVITKSCPICPSTTEWSNCESNKQIRFSYVCSANTDYICVKQTEEKVCISPKDEVCIVGWKCKDGYNIAYQSSDCSWSSIQSCHYGCNNSECIVPKDIEEQYPKEDLGVDIKPPQVTKCGFICQIIEFIINLIKNIFGG